LAPRPSARALPEPHRTSSSHHGPGDAGASAPRALTAVEGKRLQRLVDRYEKSADAEARRGTEPTPPGEVAALRDRLETVIIELDQRVAQAEARAVAAEARAEEVLHVARALTEQEAMSRRRTSA
jgi:hypothetical protein